MTILVLYYHDLHYPLRTAVRDHLFFLSKTHPELNVAYHNCRFAIPRPLAEAGYDAVILSTTLLALRWRRNEAATWEYLKNQIAALKGLKIALPQDDYDCSAVLDRFLVSTGTSVVYSCVSEKNWPILYPLAREQAQFLPAFTGFLSDDLVRRANELSLPWSSRPMDVSYRASELPFWFGRHGQLKSEISRAAVPVGNELDIRMDISNDFRDTLYGDDWIAFLGRSKAVLGVESGSSLDDPEGEIQGCIRALQATNPRLTFDEAEAACFPKEDGKHVFGALSPRHWESCATKTLQILIEGEYSGVLKPNVHFVPIRRDLSDIGTAFSALKNANFCETIIRNAHSEFVLSGKYSYRSFSEELLKVIARHDRGRYRRLSRGETLRQNWVNRAKTAALSPIFGIGRKVMNSRIPLIRDLARQTYRQLFRTS